MPLRGPLALFIVALCLTTTAAASEPSEAAAAEAVLRAARIDTDNASLLRYFRDRTVGGIDARQVERWIEELGDDSFFVRENASARLGALGNAAMGALRQAELNSDDPEVVHRARKCLQEIRGLSGVNVARSAARLLRLRRTQGATAVLLDYLSSASSDAVSTEVRRTLAALAMRDGKPNATLVRALSDHAPAHRVEAAAALCDGGATTMLPKVRLLLKDPDASVRLGAAHVLVRHGEREGVPVLIELLAQLPIDQAWRAEELLCRLAEDDAPDAAIDSSDRQSARNAWVTWWRNNGATVDLGKLRRPIPLRGYTMVVLFDGNVLMELDKDGHTPRWRIAGLQKPLDAQQLPGNRVLVAEHDANQITERSTKTGAVRWQFSVDNPLMAQRLDNGNTFIACGTTIAGRVLEVDHAGHEVFKREFGSALLRAVKLADGEFACVFDNGSTTPLILFDADGTELRTFPVEVHTIGGRIDLLPNGNAIVPELRENRVVEYSPVGKSVWQAHFDQPVAAVRLANGHTLVTSFSADVGAVELDRAGKHVWQYKSESKVTRAWRR